MVHEPIIPQAWPDHPVTADEIVADFVTMCREGLLRMRTGRGLSFEDMREQLAATVRQGEIHLSKRRQ